MNIVDWIIVIIFLSTVMIIGILYNKRNKNLHDYFLGGRNMPTWLVSFAVVGASISAGTFVGAPQLAYEGNFTYIMLSVGAILGGILVTLVFLPKLYKANTITIYGYLGQRFGSKSAFLASIVFLLGQLLTAGSRLFIAAIAVSVLLYNDIMTSSLIYSIIILGIITTIYTMAGGIKGLIVIDTIQILIVIFTGILCIFFILDAIPADIPEIIAALKNSPEGNKLLMVDTRFSFADPYNLMGGLIACTIFKFAQFGTDHEFVQRSLTCRSVKKANMSLIYSQLISLPIVIIFMIIGFLLYIFYSRPDIMGVAVPGEVLKDSRQIFPQYIFNHLPVGLLGLSMVGLLSAALSSFNSAINAMSSSFVSDILIPLRKNKKNKENLVNNLSGSKLIIVIMGVLLTLVAVLSVFLQEAGGQTLVDFALGVMCFSYSGLLGVFLCAVFTKRGNIKSVIGALLSGIIVVLFLQPYITPLWTKAVFGDVTNIAWPWWVVIGGITSFVICILGKPAKL